MGDLPSWIEAIATVLAFMAAGWAVKKSSDLLKIEQKRDRVREDEDAERRKEAERDEQADLVAAWSHWNDRSGTLDLRVSGWGALVVNSSPLPVYDVTVDFHGPSGDLRGSKELHILIPGSTFLGWPQRLLRDGEEQGAGRQFRVAIRFRDTAGRVWLRDRHGQLTKTGETRFVDATDTVTVSDSLSVRLTRSEDPGPE